MSKRTRNRGRGGKASFICDDARPVDVTNRDVPPLAMGVALGVVVPDKDCEAWAGLTDEERMAKDALVRRCGRPRNNLPGMDAIRVHCADMALAEACCATLEGALSDGRYGDATLDMILWACDNGFFESPASTRFHLCVPGGLSLHSLGVTRTALDLMEDDKEARDELGDNWREITAICAAFHDACKVGYYERLEKPDRDGAMYTVADDRKHDFEHGERSVQLMHSVYGDLLPPIAYKAVEWHMGEFDHRILRPKWEHVSDEVHEQAMIELDNLTDTSAFVRLLHHADSLSTDGGL